MIEELVLSVECSPLRYLHYSLQYLLSFESCLNCENFSEMETSSMLLPEQTKVEAEFAEPV